MTLPHSVWRLVFYHVFGALVIALAMLTPAEAGSNVTFNPSTLRFGEVLVGQSQSLSATVINTGTRSLTVSTVSGSSGAYSVQHPTLPLTLASGKGMTLTVTFHPTVAGPSAGSIALNGGMFLALEGFGASSKSLLSNPSSVSFGNVSTGATAKSYVTLTNNRSWNVTVASDSVRGSGFTVQGLSTPLTLTPGQSFTFTVEFSPASLGVFSGTFSAFNLRGAQIVSIPLTGAGAAAGQLTLSPSSIAFGNISVGSSASKSGSLSASGSSVTVSSVSSSNSQFTISGISLPKTIAAGQSVPFTVTFSPQSSGSASANIAFVSNANSVSESVSGNGQQQNYSVSLTWDASTSSVSGYNVYRSSVSGGPYAKMNGSVDPTTTYTDNTVAPSSTYYYVTTAVNSSGQESGYSNQVQVVIP
jgi:hypothetical protein